MQLFVQFTAFSQKMNDIVNDKSVGLAYFVHGSSHCAPKSEGLAWLMDEKAPGYLELELQIALPGHCFPSMLGCPVNELDQTFGSGCHRWVTGHLIHT